MPLNLTKIAANTAQASFLYGDDRVTLTYYPGRVTKKVLADLITFEMMTSETFDEGVNALNEGLCHLIKTWDVFEDEAQTAMFPLDPERLGELPTPFLGLVLRAILDDVRGGANPNGATPQTKTKS